MCAKTVLRLMALAVLLVVLATFAVTADGYLDYYYSRKGDENYKYEILRLTKGGHVCRGDKSSPKIALNTDRFADVAVLLYGNDIIVSCSSEDVNNLVIIKGNEILRSNFINATTVQFCEKRPNLGDYYYICVNTKTICKDSVGVSVLPVFMATSPSIQELNKFSIHGSSKYFLPFGEDYEVICSGDDIKPLSIGMIFDHQSTIIKYKQTSSNSTTIIHRTRASTTGSNHYECRAGDRTRSDEFQFVNSLTVIVDYLPECHDFWCIIRDWTVLECNWRYSRSEFRFSLLYTELDVEDKNEIPMCFDMLGETNNIYKWNIKHTGQQSFVINSNFSVELTTCSSITCNNQTYVRNTNMVTIIDRPGRPYIFGGYECYGTILFKPSTIRVASVSDESDWKTIHCEICEYRVDYRRIASSEAWRQVNTDQATFCKYKYGSCELTVRLPYPNTTYEVQIYTRLNGATDNRVWSEPTEIETMTTQPRKTCACDASPDTSTEPTVSFETVSCKACTLVEDAIKESLELRDKIEGPLKEKRAKAKELSKLLLQSKETAERLKNFG